MSETEISVQPAAEARPARRGAWVVLGVVLGLLLAGGLACGEVYLWHLSTLQNAEDAQFTGLQAQINQLQAQLMRAQPAPDAVSVQADLAQKYIALAAQVNAVQAQVAADHGALTSVQANAADLTKLTARIELLNQLAGARMALDAGLPLGVIAHAPPALARYASAAPPTEAALRLSFARAAAAAQAASISGDAHISYWARVREKLASLITISDGTHVIIGGPAAAVIGLAQAQLDAGDLAGAVAQLGTLSLPTQQAMAGWLAQARGLLAARTALIAMAAQG
ncbi:MAG: hypothetical protein POH28_08910 [Acidocella sp.]|nr:hypothetical protein [Acidocella sp.]